MEKTTIEILTLFADHDIHDMLFWRTDEKYAPITFFVNTNDLLSWGCADAQKIDADNLPVLRKAIEDCNVVDPVCGCIDGCLLFACRVNEMRPQGASYQKDKNLWPLFDACGPERKMELGNPYAPGEYEGNG